MLMDDATLGRKMRSRSETAKQIEALESRIKTKVASFFNLITGLQKDPASIHILEDGGLIAERGKPVSPDTIRALASELSELKKLRTKLDSLTQQLAHEGF